MSASDPERTSSKPLFDHFVGQQLQRIGNGKSERACRMIDMRKVMPLAFTSASSLAGRWAAAAVQPRRRRFIVHAIMSATPQIHHSSYHNAKVPW